MTRVDVFVDKSSGSVEEREEFPEHYVNGLLDGRGIQIDKPSSTSVDFHERKRLGGRPKKILTKEVLLECKNYTLEAAAMKLGVSCSTLKRHVMDLTSQTWTEFQQSILDSQRLRGKERIQDEDKMPINVEVYSHGRIRVGLPLATKSGALVECKDCTSEAAAERLEDPTGFDICQDVPNLPPNPNPTGFDISQGVPNLPSNPVAYIHNDKFETVPGNILVPQLDSPHQPPLDSSNNGHSVVTAEENISVGTSLEEGKRKTQRENRRTRCGLMLEDIRRCVGMKRQDAAKNLGVSMSTFKRACRKNGICRWPSPQTMQNFSLFQPSPVEIQGQTLQVNYDQPSYQAVPGAPHMKPGVQDANRVTIRAKYKNKTIKFHLSYSSRLVEFQQEVAKRLHLEAGTYYAEYKDDNGELIFIACDDDLQDCMHTSRSQGNTSIEVLLKLEEPLST